MATFKFLVLPHQRKEDGTYNVKIRITQKGKSKYIKTSHNVSVSDIIKKKDNGKERQRKRKNQDQESSRNRPNGRDDIRI